MNHLIMSDIDDEIDPEGDPEEPQHRASVAPRPSKGKRPARTPVGGTSFQKEANEADLVWNELVEWLPSQHLSPHDVAITVKRISPPHPEGGSMPMGRSFGGEAVAGGDETPGSALTQYILRYYHLASGDPRPATYDIYFTRKATGGKLSVGRINLPSAAECKNLMSAADQAAMGQAVGAPIPIPPARPWQPQPIPPSFGAPPPVSATPAPAASGFSQEMQMMMLQEMINAARENRQPVMPAQVTQPQPQVGLSDHDVDRIAARVAGIMGTGQPSVVQPAQPVASPAVQTVATPPAAAAPADGSFEAMVRRTFNGVVENMFKTAMGSVEKSMKQGMGMGSPGEAAEPEEVPAQIVPEDPTDAIPWKVADVGSSWSDSRPMKVALDKESGNIDLMGTMMANPVIAEKAMDLANGLGEALKQFMQARTPGAPPPAAQVVQRIPQGAVDAMPHPNGVAAPTGWEAP
jgi:hypothetical protein